MGSYTERIDHALYPHFHKNWGDSVLRARILRRIRPTSYVLEIGAGAGIVSQMNFRGLAARVYGVDLDRRVRMNPYLDEAQVADATELPYPDSEFDVVFADNVLEHLAEPLQVFREVRRMLRPGGCFLFKTPNCWHYVAVAARLTPYSFHRFFDSLRGRAADDTFQTLYRANTARDIGYLASQAGFDVELLEYIEGRPEHLRPWWPTYLLGAAYERCINMTERLAFLRAVLIGELRKV